MWNPRIPLTSHLLVVLAVAGPLASGCAPAAETEAVSPDKADGTNDVPAELMALAPEYFDYTRQFAQEGVGVARAPAGGIFLRAHGCDRLREQVNALIALRQRIDPLFAGGSDLAQERSLADGWCEAKLDTLLTPYLAQTLWKRIDDTSVDTNCWAHALKTVEAIPSIQVASAELFTHVLASPQCRMLAADEQTSPGDIIAIRLVDLDNAGTMTFEESHGAVFVTDDLWITKNGASEFNISPASRVLEEYGSIEGKPRCSLRTDLTVTPEHVADCGFVIQAARCQTRQELLAENPAGHPTFSAQWPVVEGLLDERVLMQQEQEGLEDGIIAEGMAYISRHPFDHIVLAYDERNREMPEQVRRYLQELAQDSRLQHAYDLTQPALPALPAALVDELSAKLGDQWHIYEGDGFETFCAYFAAREQDVFSAFETAGPSLSAIDRQLLLTLLFQLDSSDCRSNTVADRLSAFRPSRIIRPPQP